MIVDGEAAGLAERAREGSRGTIPCWDWFFFDGRDEKFVATNICCDWVPRLG